MPEVEVGNWLREGQEYERLGDTVWTDNGDDTTFASHEGSKELMHFRAVDGLASAVATVHVESQSPPLASSSKGDEVAAWKGARAASSTNARRACSCWVTKPPTTTSARRQSNSRGDGAHPRKKCAVVSKNRCRPGRTSEAAGDDLLLSPPTNLRCTLVGRAAVERLGGMPTSGPGADDAGARPLGFAARRRYVRRRWKRRPLLRPHGRRTEKYY